ncbi:MAG: alkyl sulfatase dimerization domain-containing protein [Acidimicrobiales bacterium]
MRGVIYTHGHPDHVWGTRAWVSPEDEPGVEIVAHETVPYYVNEFANILAPATRSAPCTCTGRCCPTAPRGSSSTASASGCAPGRTGASSRRPPPSATSRRLTIAGVRLQVQFTPGESPDEILVWLPDDGIVLSADTVYRSFPNVYTIRGARYRDPRDWYSSVDRIRALGAEHLVPCHGAPVSGAAEVDAVLTTYRDGIQYVFDQTIRGMNAGRTPDELAATVRLPEHLASSPWLAELYGKVEICVRNIYAGLYGWFSGDGADLLPPPPGEEAAEVVALAGGPDAAAAALRDAVADGRMAWAAKLASWLLRAEPAIDEALAEEVKRLKATALRSMAYATINANARNWWLTEAAVLDGTIAMDLPAIAGFVARSNAAELLHGVPERDTVEALSLRLDPERSADTTVRVGLALVDATPCTLAIRRGVCAIEDGVDGCDLTVTLRRDDLIALVTGALSWHDALATDEVALDGDRDRLLATVALFDGWEAPEG